MLHFPLGDGRFADYFQTWLMLADASYHDGLPETQAPFLLQA
jgi:hypothetical protein